MGVTGELVVRELLLLAVLTSAGGAPAAVLPGSFTRYARVALAPVLGLCLLVCLFTTLEWFFPARSVAFVVPLVCGGSLVLGAFVVAGSKRTRRVSVSRRDVIALAQLLLICVVVALPTTSALASHDSVGPVSFEVYDGPGYVANADAAQVLSISKAASIDTALPAYDNYVDLWWAAEARDSTRLDYAPVVAALDSLVGLGASATYAPDLIALIVAGALGMFGSILFASGRETYFAALGGMVFGGSFFLQLFFDGSQAAITGLVVVVPLIVLGAAAVSDARWRNLALVALVLAGLSSLYPIFLSPLLLAAIVVLVGYVLRHVAQLRGRLLRSTGVLAAKVLFVVVLAALFDLVAAVRNVSTLSGLLAGGGILSSFPAYHLGAGVVASWLLQTRDLYAVAFGPQSPFYDLVPALLIPVAVVVAAVAGLRRRPVAWFALLVVALSCMIAAYETAKNGCGYCEDRSLLSSVPPITLFVFTGLGSLCASRHMLGRGTALVVTALFLSFVGYDAANARQRYDDTAYFLPSSLRTLVAQIPPSARSVEIEGFNALPQAMAADTYVYELVFEHTRAVSVATEQSSTGLAEDWGPRPLDSPIFRPDYADVLSALPEIDTARRTVVRIDGIALERRAEPVDVTIESGVSLAPDDVAPEVISPVWFVLSGVHASNDVVRARFFLPLGGHVPAQDGVRLVHHGHILDACISSTGTGSIATAHISLPLEKGISLESMRAVTGPCAPKR